MRATAAVAALLALAAGISSAMVVRAPEAPAPVAAAPETGCTPEPTGSSRGSAPEPQPAPEAAAPDEDAALRRTDAYPAPRKTAWEQSVGGPAAAKEHLRRRLSGWPVELLAARGSLPRDEGEFLWRVARDTWRGIAALTDRQNGLPIDHVRFAQGSLVPAEAQIGDYVSPGTLGLYFLAVSAAQDLGLVSRAEALSRLGLAMQTIEALESHRGMLYNFYDTTSLERTSGFVSFVDSAWLAAGLIVVRRSFPELAVQATRLIDARDFGFFYDSAQQQMSHGYYVDAKLRSPYHYSTLYTEARLGSLIAIGKGDVSEEHWFRMLRTFPEACTWQSLPPQNRREKQVRGHALVGGFYEWQGLRYVPSWGGSMFEALMPSLVVDERGLAPRSLGRNAQVHVAVQQRYALEVLGFPVWGMSPAAAPGPDGYREYGVPVLGARGYEGSAVTPHAVALALPVDARAAVSNLQRLAERYDIYGEYGFFDSVDPRSGAIGAAYLALDQAMLFVALANHLGDGIVQQRFASDPIARRALSILADEDFLD